MSTAPTNDVNIEQTVDIKVLNQIVREVSSNADAGTLNIIITGPVYNHQENIAPRPDMERLKGSREGLLKLQAGPFVLPDNVSSRFAVLFKKLPSPKFDCVIRMMVDLACAKEGRNIKDVARYLECSYHQARFFMRKYGVST
jgi:hypothetical protein